MERLWGVKVRRKGHNAPCEQQNIRKTVLYLEFSGQNISRQSWCTKKKTTWVLGLGLLFLSLQQSFFQILCDTKLVLEQHVAAVSSQSTHPNLIKLDMNIVDAMCEDGIQGICIISTGSG